MSNRAYGSNKRAKRSDTLVLYRGVKPETKFVISNFGYTGVNVLRDLTNIDQGTAGSNRIGNKIKFLRVDGFLRSAAAVGFRISLLSPKESSTTIPGTISTCLDTNDFWVIKDWFVGNRSDPNVSFGQGGCNGHFFSIKFPMGANVEYSGALGTAIRKNHMLLRVISESSDSVEGFTRCWYTDA